MRIFVHIWLLVLLSLVAAACSSTVEQTSAATEVGDITAPQVEDETVAEVAVEEEAPNPDELEATGPIEDDETEDDDESEIDAVDGEPEATTECVSDATFPAARTDLRIDGNRIEPGAVDLATTTRSAVPIPGNAEWIVPDPSQPGGWYVSLASGQAVRVSVDGNVEDAGAAPIGPPELTLDGEALSPFANHGLFEDPLPDSRVVTAGDIAVALAGPTDRYAHAVLGDALEASAIVFVDLCTNERGRIEIPAPDVIEGVAPLLADVDGDTELEILVTVSNGDGGARLVVYEFSGTILAESEPIGRGNRWRNQLAVAPFGPNGEVEIVDVRTPHIGGTVQAFALSFGNDDGPTLERVAASDARYTSHVIGTGNLDMGLAIDGNVDGRLDVVVPTAERNSLIALTRTSESQGWAEIAALPLEGILTSNLVSQTVGDRTTLAAGAGSTIFVWG